MKNLGSLFYKPKNSSLSDNTPKRWNPFRIIGKAVMRTCTALGAMILISVLISVIMLSTMGGKTAPPLPDEFVLVLKIDGGVTEIQTRPSILEPFPFSQPTVRGVVNAMDRAKADNRVKGLIVSLKNNSMSVAHIQELRTAIARFKESGKFTKIYSSSYDDPMGGLSQYYFASIFDEIWMQPVGMLSISGPNMEMPYTREALDKIGVQPHFLKREKYKGAMENFTDTEMSEESRQMWSALIGNMSTRMMSDITQSREINLMELGKQVDKGVLTGGEALAAKLIDRLDYSDVMVSEIRKEITGDPENKDFKLVSFGHYADQKKKTATTPKTDNTKRPDVALIYVVGAIVDTSTAQGNAAADKITGAIIKAYEDENIEAIILRVDSPGGSPSASETIRRALVKAKEKGKKVIVSMGPVAASGGYWVSTDADKIFALPGTITGSIGVVMGKFEASDLWRKLGINWQGPQIGENADLFSLNQPFDEKQQERMNVLIDDVYDAFLTRVAQGRGMTKEQAREVAQGRAWTGEQAKINGLVDDLGGLDFAMDETAKMLGMQNRDDLNIVRLPRERNRIEQLLEMVMPQASLGKFFGLETALGKNLKLMMTQAELSQENAGATVYQAELEMLR